MYNVLYTIVSLQLWARVHRDDHYHAAVDTNNEAEAINKTLKYNYLPKGKSVTLSHLVRILVEEFLPEMLQKYQKQNFAMSESYRMYNEFVPSYLQGRPRPVILHCLSRIRKADRFTKESVEQMDGSGQFKIKSASGKQHTLKFKSDNKMPECTCKDWTCWHIPCKHFLLYLITFQTGSGQAYQKSILRMSTLLLTQPYLPIHLMVTVTSLLLYLVAQHQVTWIERK